MSPICYGFPTTVYSGALISPEWSRPPTNFSPPFHFFHVCTLSDLSQVNKYNSPLHHRTAGVWIAQVSLLISFVVVYRSQSEPQTYRSYKT